VLALQPPVEAPIVRHFDYRGSPFAAGLHRGVDFATRAGEVVRAPCSGRVAWAGASGLTLLCDGRRVTLLPVAPRVQGGSLVAAGATVGAARGEPLHLGVRRPKDPFGYLDPERFLNGAPPPLPAIGPRWAPRPWTGVRARAAPPAPAAPVPAPIAPWPAWAGLAAALAGTAGGGAVRRRRAARTRAAAVRAGPEVVS
jgi:hypothetical protein